MLAVAAPANAMRVYKAGEMAEAQLREFTARPRIDFNSILSTVSNWCGTRIMAAFAVRAAPRSTSAAAAAAATCN